MKVVIIGVSKNKVSGKSKAGNPYSGYFVTFGYERPSVNGYEAKSMLYSESMIQANNGYIPVPGDECEAALTFNGFIEALTPVTAKK